MLHQKRPFGVITTLLATIAIVFAFRYRLPTALANSCSTSKPELRQAFLSANRVSVTETPASDIPVSDPFYPLSDQGNTGKWILDPTVSDEFNDKSLDLTKWHPGIQGWLGRPPGLISPANVEEKNGNLDLTIRHRTIPPEFAAQGYANFTTPAVESLKKVTYGYFEVRAKAMNSAGSSAFWLSDQTPVSWNEIDVFEMGGKSPANPFQVFSTLHVFREQGQSKASNLGKVTNVPGSVATAFHVYGLQWTATSIDIYIDGVHAKQFDNTNWHDPLYLIMDAETVPAWWGLPAFNDLPSTYQVDYIRVWHQ